MRPHIEIRRTAAALLTPASPALIGATYPKTERNGAIAVWAAASSLTTAAGPVLGGWLTETFGWQAVFWINPPIAGAAVGLLLAFAFEDRRAALCFSQKDLDAAMLLERKDLCSALLRGRRRIQSSERCVVLQTRQPADRSAAGPLVSRILGRTVQWSFCHLESYGFINKPMKMLR